MHEACALHEETTISTLVMHADSNAVHALYLVPGHVLWLVGAQHAC